MLFRSGDASERLQPHIPANKGERRAVQLHSRIVQRGCGTAVAGAAAPAAAAAEAEKSEYDVVMTSFGEKKLDVIKVVREITGMGLKDAKDLVEGVPSKVKEGVSKSDAEEIQKKLQEAGATAELK